MAGLPRLAGSVLEARAVPSSPHLALSLDWLGEFFAAKMNPVDGAMVAAAGEGRGRD